MRSTNSDAADDVRAARTYRIGGSPRDAGLALGRAIGPRLADNIARYIDSGPAQQGTIDTAKLRAGALPWLRSLPPRYVDELEGIAAGAALPLRRLAEWLYADQCLGTGCSSLLYCDAGQVWVARNNDFWAPGLWGYVTIHAIDGRLARMDFGLEGEIFTSTGVNEAGVWLHYNWLPAQVPEDDARPALPCYVWASEALETCRTLSEVEALLRLQPRDGAMLLFVVDGRDESGAMFQCTPNAYTKHPLGEGWLAGTNHSLAPAPDGRSSETSDSGRRLAQLTRRLETLDRVRAAQRRAGATGETGRGSADPPDQVTALIDILADPGVERRGAHSGTVYAAVARPGRREIWYTYGGYPAASAGTWRPVPWPWR